MNIKRTLKRILLILTFMGVANSNAATTNRIILNQGFESGSLVGSNTNGLFPMGDVEAWTTTDPTGLIELWGDGTLGGYPAREGTVFAEMNAYNSGFLYQTVYLVNGEQIEWAYSHMNRINGTSEVAKFAIYPETGTVNTTNMLATLSTSTVTVAKTWVDRAGVWTSTLATGVYRIGFVSTNSGSSGNLLDAISIGLTPFIEMTQATYSFNEGDGKQPELYVNGRVTGNPTVTISVTGGSATEGTDFNLGNLIITIPTGEYALNNKIAIPITTLRNSAKGNNIDTINFSIIAMDSPLVGSDANADGDNNQSSVINVTHLNNAPIIDSTAGTTATEDTQYIYTTEVTDVEAANNDDQQLTYLLTNAPEGMDVSSTGVITWTPPNGVTTSSAVILTVSDGGDDGAIAATETFTIAVTNVNDAPVITGQSSFEIVEDLSNYLFMSVLTVTDIDTNDVYPGSFTLTILEPSQDAKYSVVGNEIIPEANLDQDFVVPVKVNDGEVDSNVFNVLITLVPVDDSPIVHGVLIKTIDESSNIIITREELLNTDVDSDYYLTDIDSGDGDLQVIDFAVTTDNGTIAPNTDGWIITPTPGFAGMLTVNYAVQDVTVDDTNVNAFFTVNVTPIISGWAISSEIPDDGSNSVTPVSGGGEIIGLPYFPDPLFIPEPAASQTLTTAPVDFSDLTNGVVFDFTHHGLQSLGGGGGSGSWDITQVTSSQANNIYRFSWLHNGDSFTIMDGTDNDTIDLSLYLSSEVAINTVTKQAVITFSGGTATVNFGGVGKVLFRNEDVNGSPEEVSL